MALPFVVLCDRTARLLKETLAMLHFPVDVSEFIHIHVSVVHSLVHLEVRRRWSRIPRQRTRLLRVSRLPTHAAQPLLRRRLPLLHVRVSRLRRRLSPTGIGTVPRHVSLLPAAEAGERASLRLSGVPATAGLSGTAKQRRPAGVVSALVFPEEEAASLRVAAALEEGAAVVGSRLVRREASGCDAAVAAHVWRGERALLRGWLSCHCWSCHCWSCH